MVAEPEPAGVRETHLLRGVLEMTVLAILAVSPTHAYDVVERLRARGFATVGYGTIYPLVTRLRRLGLVLQEPQPSPTGPPRNVLRLTAEGQDALGGWQRAWHEITAATEAVLAELDEPAGAR